MKYHVELTVEAKKKLKKMDKYTASFILGWGRKHLEGCSEPRQYGKSLTANHQGEWRYRVGDYRLLADIQDDKILILILTIGHRHDVYK